MLVTATMANLVRELERIVNDSGDVHTQVLIDIERYNTETVFTIRRVV